MATDTKRKREDDHDGNDINGSAGALDADSQTKDVASPVTNDVEGKAMPTRHPKKKRIDGERTKWPELNYVPGKVDPSVRIADLQSLLLYCFADGTAPQWISIKHSGHMRKAVVLMVPGLEMDMFNGRIPLEPLSTTEMDPNSSSSKPQEEEASPEERKAAEFERWMKGLPVEDNSGRFSPKSLEQEKMPGCLRPLAQIFRHVWPIKSPGDNKFNKVHSPLQAFLLTPLPKSKEKSQGKGPRPARVDKNFAAKRTPITTFISTQDQLRENDYIVHPAFLTSDAEKSAELEIRQRNNQTEKDGWFDTHVPNLEAGDVPDSEIESGSITSGRDVLALDCEMCLTEGGQSELTRISILNWNGEVVMDELVQPPRPVTDYLTRYSGITKELLDPVTTTLQDIQQKLLSLITPRTILVGHSLNSDLGALKLTHPFIVDTGIIYPHPRGPPLKSSLRWLTQKYLNREIQKNSEGHDSVEDARAVLELVKQKCEKGAQWGTSDASNESIFTRLARGKGPRNSSSDTGRTGAVVDWGNPERGYGAQATAAVGCTNDEAVAQGVSNTINGDDSNPAIPENGVDVTWARLRNLEQFRGWCNRLPDASNANESTEVTLSENAKQESSSSYDPALADTVSQTVSHISQIYESLPPRTLFIVYSGTGDPREVSRLQAMHKQYRSEFQSGTPWDQLSVKWTDTEQQALAKACEKARQGCGFMTVKQS